MLFVQCSICSKRGVTHGHFIVNHSINPRHDQGGVQCDGEVNRMEFLKALIAMFLFMSLVTGVCAKYDMPLPSYDTQVLSLAIVAAGVLAHSDK